MSKKELKINPEIKTQVDSGEWEYLKNCIADIWHGVKDKEEASEQAFMFMAVCLAADQNGKVKIDKDNNNIDRFIEKNFDYIDGRTRHYVSLAEMN